MARANLAPEPEPEEVITGAILIESPPAAARPAPVGAVKKVVERILRFRRSERLLHWSIALPFLVCAGSAVVLVAIFNPDPTLPHRELVSMIHRISGALLIGLPPLVLITHLGDYRTHLANIREGAVWTFDDFKWLALMPLSMISKKVKLPEEGKFNAGEKMNFCMVLSMYPVMGTTGLVIWLMGSALLPWLVHFSMAAAMMPLIGGHIFMATINPASRVGLSGMFSGLVDRKWASHHYRRWFKENFDADPHGHELDAFAAGAHKTEVIPREAIVAAALAAKRSRGMIRYATFAATLAVAVLAMFYLRPYAARAMVSTLSVPVEKTTAVLLVESPLLTRPVSDAAVVPGKLEKATKVVRFGDFGPYALVQDPQGRAGYVLAASLGPEPLPIPIEPEKPAVAVVPEAPAPSPVPDGSDCVQTSSEPDSTACVMRAEATLTDCVDACAAETSKGCAEVCQSRHDTCVASCTGTSNTPANEPARPLGWNDSNDSVPQPGVKPAAKAKVRPSKSNVKPAPKRRPR